MRLKCHLFGCDPHYYLLFCMRCDSHAYDGNFIHRGWLERPVEIAMATLRWFWFFVRPPKCDICGARLSRDRLEWGVCEQEECVNAWIPF